MQFVRDLNWSAVSFILIKYGARFIYIVVLVSPPSISSFFSLAAPIRKRIVGPHGQRVIRLQFIEHIKHGTVCKVWAKLLRLVIIRLIFFKVLSFSTSTASTSPAISPPSSAAAFPASVARIINFWPLLGFSIWIVATVKFFRVLPLKTLMWFLFSVLIWILHTLSVAFHEVTCIILS